MSTEIVLIGSRALNKHIPERKINGKDTDYDFVATFSGAFKWLATLGENMKFDKVDYPYDQKTHNADIEHDLKNWKHLNSKLGIELYSVMKTFAGVTKLKGHTDQLKFEIEIASPGSSGATILQLTEKKLIMKGDELKTETDNYEIASLAVLEAIKTSHIIFPYNWRKHMEDLDLIRAKLGREKNYVPKRSEDLEKLIIHRRLEHYMRLGVPGSHINLNKMNEDFLENESLLYVDKYIKHDDIHLRVMIDGKAPAYDELRTDKNKAMMSKDLFEKASPQMQLNCVREEAMSIALERYLLPDREKDAQVAYTKALIRVCTTLTKGWFREFAVNVYHLVCKLETDLMKIKKEIRDEHAKAEAEKKMVAEKIAMKLQSTAQIRHSSYSKGFAYRIEHLLPLIFDDEDELKLAQAMAENLTERESGVYECVLDDEEIDMVFSADADYEYEDGGWCECYNRWHAYITVTDKETYEDNTDEWRFMQLSYSQIGEYHSNDHKDHVRLAFSMSVRADDSYSDSPSMHNVYAKSLDDLADKSGNSLVTSNFLMRFIMCVAYPAKFTSGGDSAMPDSDVHYLYEVWDKNC